MKEKKRFLGQSLIEFALLFPVFILLVMGLFDIGRAIFYFSALNNAVREGTRVAIVQDFKLFGDYQVDNIDLSINPDPCSIEESGNEYEGTNCPAHENICIAIKNKTFNIGELINSRIIIEHKDTGSDDPKINIRIEFDYGPTTPIIGQLIGNIPINVQSQMFLTPIAKPLPTPIANQ